MSQGPRDVMETVFKRIEFLEALAKDPSEKRELVDRLDVSRSTVNRGLWDLEQYNLVEYDRDAYRLTITGRLFHEQYTQYEASAATVTAASDLLQYLPPDAPISMEFLRGADVFVSEDPVPHVPATVLAEIVEQAERLRAFSRAHASPKSVDALREVLQDGGVAEIVFREQVFEHVRSTYDWFADRIAAGDIRPYLIEDVPYGLILADQDEETYGCIVVYDEESSIAGILVNDTQAALEWATDLFRLYRDKAQAVPELELD